MNTFPTVQRETLKVIALLKLVEEEIGFAASDCIDTRNEFLDEAMELVNQAVDKLKDFAEVSDVLTQFGMASALEHEEEAVARVGQKVIDKEGGKGIIEDLCAEYAVVRHGTKIRKVPWDRIALSAVVPPPSL